MQYSFEDVMWIVFPPPRITRAPTTRPGKNHNRNFFINNNLRGLN
jgi:hypothetical protein